MLARKIRNCKYTLFSLPFYQFLKFQASVNVLYRKYFKRWLDVILTIFLLIALFPLMLLIAIAITLEDGASPFYIHDRIGRHGKRFQFYKFRSMPVGTKQVPSPEAGGLKITRVGRVIRRLSVDELPQLINILKGDMSLVGPRPVLPSQEDMIALRQQNGSIDCVPGITGLCQVEAWSEMTTAQKAEFDKKYADHLSFVNDIIIMLRTFTYLLKPPPTD